MNPLVIGSREDVAGFALAGVGGMICTTVADVEHAFANLGSQDIVILSATAAILAADRIAEAEKSASSPLFVILPSS